MIDFQNFQTYHGGVYTPDLNSQKLGINTPTVFPSRFGRNDKPIHYCNSTPGLFDAGYHAVVLMGWGEDADTQTPYWIVRNSYGTEWGIQGILFIPPPLHMPPDCFLFFSFFFFVIYKFMQHN
jgi:hypothetical protein